MARPSQAKREFVPHCDAGKISDEAAAAVAEVSQTVNGALQGDARAKPVDVRRLRLSSTGTLRIRMHNKLPALVALGKRLGMFGERRQNTCKRHPRPKDAARKLQRQTVVLPPKKPPIPDSTEAVRPEGTEG
jgi:hypothetical protein